LYCAAPGSPFDIIADLGSELIDSVRSNVQETQC
jgi:hypothetical protein